MKDKFEFKIIEEWLGYNSSNDKTTLKTGTLIRGSKNVYKKLSGTIATRPGIKTRGSDDATNAGVKAETVWNTSVGTTRPLRVCNGKLQVESDIVTDNTFVWYDLLESVTLAHPASTLTRFIFDTWWDNDEKEDKLLMVRGDDAILSWSGGMAIIASTTVNGTNGLGTAVISNSGSGYAVGDILTLVVGTNTKVRVLTLSGTGVEGIEIYDRGSGLAGGDIGIQNTNGGTGTGATVNILTIQASYYSITKSGSETWAELGFVTLGAANKKIIINGLEFSYTAGYDTTTLTGVPEDTSSLTAGMIAIQSIIVTSNIPIDTYKADFIKVINNQAWIGSYTSRLIYISADTDFTDFTNGGTLVSGDPDALILDNQARGIGTSGDGKVVIFAGDADLYVVTPNIDLNQSQTLTPLTGGSGRIVIQRVEKKKMAGLSACLGQEFIDNMGEYTVWLDQKNRLRAVGTFTNVAAIKPANLSLHVQRELSEDDFTGGHLKVVADNDGDTVYITAPNNGRDWMYQVRESIDNSGQIISQRAWQPPQLRGISRFSVIDGVLYGHSNVNPMIFQIWDTGQWFDDNADGEEIPYTPVVRLCYLSHGRRQGLLYFNKVYFEGYMKEGMDLKSNIYLDYQGASGTRELSIDNDTTLAKFYTGFSQLSLGQSAFGSLPLGDGILDEVDDQDLIPKFRTIQNVPDPKNCFEYSIEVYSTQLDCRWEILFVGTNVVISDENPVFLRK